MIAKGIVHAETIRATEFRLLRCLIRRTMYVYVLHRRKSVGRRQGDPQSLNHPILTARHYSWITLAFTIFVIYGSLVPLTFQPVPFDFAWARFSRAFTQPVAVSNRSDWLANVLLFIPLGFVSMGCLSVDRTSSVHSRRVLVISSLLIVFALLSASIEFVQIWFPPRHTSINDVAAETLGGAIGIGVWLLLGQSITDYLRRFWTNHGADNWAVRLIPAYLVILVIAQGMPFDLTLSPGDLGRKYRAGRVLPIPFTSTNDELFDMVRSGLIQFAFFLPAGMLIAGLPGWIASGRCAALRVLVIGVVLAGAIEVMQLFIFSRTSDSTDIVTGSIAVLAGWRLMQWFLAKKDVQRSQQARSALLQSLSPMGEAARTNDVNRPGHTGRIMNAREAVKWCIRGLANLFILPLLVIHWLKVPLIGSDRALEGSTELLSLFPGLIGQYLRRAFLGWTIEFCHPSAAICFGTVFSKAGARIDENAYIGGHCHIGLVHVQRDVLIASGVHITSGARMHGTDDLTKPIKDQQGVNTLVTIGQGAWIGSLCVVMADVGRDSIIGAGAVVSKAIPERSVAAGVPAKVLRSRDDNASARPIA